MPSNIQLPPGVGARIPQPSGWISTSFTCFCGSQIHHKGAKWAELACRHCRREWSLEPGKVTLIKGPEVKGM